MLHQKSLCALALCVLSSGLSTGSFAFELGVDSIVAVNASDNIDGANAGSELEGALGYARFGVFGEQVGTSVRGAFSGEFTASKQLDDADDDITSITQFIGAVEVQITPRAFSWYIGDILGSVTTDEGLQSFDSTEDVRRNVFVTGPEFNYDLDSFSRVNARFLYVNQSQDGLDLESLFNTNASWSFDTDNGNTFGFLGSNVFTDNPDSALEGDFNRFSLAGTWSRTRGRITYEAQLGGTRYDTKDESLNGLNASLAFTRQLGPQTNFRIGFTQDLRDQTLSTVESLIADGTGTDGDGDGFFDESRIDARYSFTSSVSTFDIGAAVGYSDFRLIAADTGFSSIGDTEDRTNASLFTNYSYVFSPRTRFNSSLSLTYQDFLNLEDESQSVLGTVQIVRSLGRSFEIQLGYRFFASQGERTRSVLNVASALEDIDVTENRATLALRWAPPTRASKDLTIEMKSLLQR